MRKVCSAWHMKLFLSGRCRFRSYSWYCCCCCCCLLQLFVCMCVLLLRNFQTKHQTHDTPNYFTCSNFLLFLLRFFALSLPLGECVCLCVFVWQLCNHFIRTDFIFIVACCLPFYLLFCVSCFVRLLLFFTCRALCFSLENFFTIVCFLLWNFIVYKTFSFDFFCFFSGCVYMCMLYKKYIYIYIVYVNKQFTHSTGIRFAPIASYCCVCMCLSACMLFYRSGMGHFSQLCLLWSHTHIHKNTLTPETTSYIKLKLCDLSYFFS